MQFINNIMDKRLLCVHGFIFELEDKNPLFYVRNNKLISNMYKDDSHPNDKKASYKRNQSKGRMLGLEEAGWVGIIPSMSSQLEYILTCTINDQL